MNIAKITDSLREIAVALLLISGAGSLPGQIASWSDGELRGKSIYRTGRSPANGEIRALIGGGSTEVDGTLMPCVNCHGIDGRGRPESGVVPSSLRWADLTRPYEVLDSAGRRRGPYDQHLLVRAITLGIDSSGNRLGPGMPRFSLSKDDAADLIAYLGKLSADSDPGMTASSVDIGIVLPSGKAFPSLGAAVRAALEAYFAEVSAGGGIYGRRLNPVFHELPSARATKSDFDGLMRSDGVFALLSSFMAGAEEEITSIVRERGVPLVGAWALLPEREATNNPYIFYSDGGVTGQAESLADYALGKSGVRPVIVASRDALSTAAAVAAKERFARASVSIVAEERAPPGATGADALVRRLRSAGSGEVLLCVQRPELLEIAKAAVRARWHPTFLIPGGLAGVTFADLGAMAPDAILSLPFLPSDVSSEASIEYEKLARTYSLTSQQLAAQMRALANARILVEGLKRTGSELNRERFIQALEGLYEFAPGFGPPVSFGPHRRIGNATFHLVSQDARTGGIKEITRQPR